MTTPRNDGTDGTQTLRDGEHAIAAEIHSITYVQKPVVGESKDAGPSVISDVKSLPKTPSGKQGKEGTGRCTRALLKALKQQNSPTWAELLSHMNQSLNGDLLGTTTAKSRSHGGTAAVLLSSRQLDVEESSFLQSSTKSSVEEKGQQKRAILIGIDYDAVPAGQKKGGGGPGLQSILEMKSYLESDRQGFPARNITILSDGGRGHHKPTRKNILSSFRQLAMESGSDDVAFVLFVGYGGSVKRAQGGRISQVIFPADYRKHGPISAEAVSKVMISSMAAGVTLTCCFDLTSHGGTFLELPYHSTPTDDDHDDRNDKDEAAAAAQHRMVRNEGFWQDATIAGAMIVGGGVLAVGAGAAMALHVEGGGATGMVNEMMDRVGDATFDMDGDGNCCDDCIGGLFGGGGE